MSTLRRVVTVYRSRWFVPCVALVALAAINIPAMVQPVRATARRRGDVVTQAIPKGANHQPPGGGNSTPSAGAPSLEFSAAKLDLGDGKPNETLRGKLTLTNRGTEATEFTLVRHCGCTELSPMSGKLAPGASQTIDVGVQLPDHANAEKRTSLEARVDTLPGIVSRCVLLAHCPAPFQVEPTFLSFGSVGPDDVADVSAEIRVRSVDGQPPVTRNALVTALHDDIFDVECVTASASQSNVKPEVTLRVRAKGALSPGDYWDTLALHVAGSDYCMRVPLNVCVVERIAVVPASVTLRREPLGRLCRPVQLLVIDRRRGGSLGPVKLLDGPPGMAIKDLGGARGRRRLRLSGGDKCDSWPADCQVRLVADGVTLTFRIRKPL